MKAKLMLLLRSYFGSKLMKICSFHPSSVEKSEYAVTSLKLNEMPKTN